MENIEYYLKNISLLSNNISLDNTLLTCLRNNKNAYRIDRDVQYRIMQTAKHYQYLNNYITNITIFNEYTERNFTYEYDYIQNFYNKEWYQTYISESLTEYFTGLHPSIIHGTNYDTDAYNTFSYFQKIYDPLDPSCYLGTIHIEIDSDILKKAIKQLCLSSENNVFLFNKGNQLFLNTETTIPYETVRSLIDAAPQKPIVKINSQKYYYAIASSSKFGWTLISINDYTQIYNAAKSSTFYIMITGLFLFLIMIMVSIIVSKNITAPISQITQGARLVAKGNLNVVLPVSSYHDETAELALVFNSMLKNIKELIQKDKEQEKFKRKAELTALQAQINPHFLYNTLDSLNWCAVRKKDLELSSVLTSLGKFFRISLNKGKEYLTIKEELEHVRCYLDIQQFRNSYTFEYTIDCSPDLENKQIPKLILQPIVENSLLHGLKDKREPGHITLSVSHNEEQISFKIKDDGLGISPSLLAQLNNLFLSNAPTPPSLSYGIRNVNDRIHLYFGDSCSLKIDSEENSYTLVTIQIPFGTENFPEVT